MPVDRTQLKAWYRSAQGKVFLEWAKQRLKDNGDYLSNEALDLSIPANLTQASRRQGECRPLRCLLDEDRFLDELNKIAQQEGT